MEPSALHKLQAAYLEQDDCLYLALGLAKAASDLQNWAAAGAGQAASAPQGAPDETGEGPSEAYLHFLLGLLAFAGRLEQALGGPPAPDPDGPARSPSREPVLRELLR